LGRGLGLSDGRIDDEFDVFDFDFEQLARDARGFDQVGAKDAPQIFQAKSIGRGDAQRLAAWLHPHAAAEPDRKSFLPDLAGQRAMHGRHDLPIVLGHVLARL
jgi:hypothetical protein